MGKSKENMVHCRYPKCGMLHETTELRKEDAVQGGSKNSYYHPDCYHTLQTVNKIRDLFVDRIDKTLTSKQIGMLVSTVNNIIFNKKVDVDFILFALEYIIKYKPGSLRYPAGMHYIIQDRDVISAWEKENRRKIREQIKMETEKAKQIEDVGEVFDLNPVENHIEFKNNNKSKFASILGV